MVYYFDCNCPQNVVVVGQPSTVPHTTIVQPRPRASEYLALTLVLMILCFLHGNLLAFFCLVPALICSCVVSISLALKAPLLTTNDKSTIMHC